MDPEKVEKVLDARVEATDNEKLEVSEKEAQRRQDVIIATRDEHNLTFLQAMRKYRKAVMWSVIASMSTIMESYDIQIMGGFFAYPSFQKKYGIELGNGKYSIPASWQVALKLGPNIGLVIGVFANGWLAEKYGHKRVMIAAHLVLIATIFATFFAPNPRILLIGEILCGLPWGIFAAAAPSYAAEIVPMTLRGYLTTYVNLCWVMGRLIATGVLKGLLGYTSQWGYRIPFALQWMWPAPLAIILCFAPDSPWWLVRKGRTEDAQKTLERLLSSSEDDPRSVSEASRQFRAMIEQTIQTEKDLNIGTNYAECFKGTNLRRTEVACICWAGQAVVGFAIQNYITYFFTLAGLSPDDAFKMTLGTFSLAWFGTVSSWFVSARCGRRAMYLTGLSILAPIMWAVGLSDFAPSTSALRWAQSSLLLVWFATYGVSLGPVPYAVATEVSASRLRIKTIAMARNSTYFIQILNIVVAPYMLNPQKGNLKGKAALPAAFMSTCLLVWAFFRLPETRGRTFEELDLLFAKKLSARKFGGYKFEETE
tara:strand:+ start:3618 stop:5231 length:1614 start_codon:yes stop_codon:yes gene_type:complete